MSSVAVDEFSQSLPTERLSSNSRSCSIRQQAKFQLEELAKFSFRSRCSRRSPTNTARASMPSSVAYRSWPKMPTASPISAPSNSASSTTCRRSRCPMSARLEAWWSTRPTSAPMRLRLLRGRSHRRSAPTARARSRMRSGSATLRRPVLSTQQRERPWFCKQVPVARLKV